MSSATRSARPLARAAALTTAIAALAALGTGAHAQERELRISTLEHGDWPTSVAALQHDVHADGSVLHVTVFDSGSHLARCGRYVLTLDSESARAFRTGACDARSGATELWLVSRTELFTHDGVVPRPRMVRLVATEVRTADETGGAAVTGGAALDCAVSVRPYLDDLEHGGIVYLTSDRYVARPTDASFTVSLEGDGWSLRGHASASSTIVYDVIDRQTGEVVLHDSATLSCGGGPRASAPLVASPAAPLSDAAARVLVLEGTELQRMAEVVGIVDVHEPVGGERAAIRHLRERAAEMGADAVVGVEFHHGGGGGPTHLSGLAVRFVRPG